MTKVNIKDLIPIQKEVNKVVEDRLGRRVTAQEFITAFSVELSEYMNEVGIWKWWKQSHVPNEGRVLNELADCFAFFLSALIVQDEIYSLQGKTNIIEETEEMLQSIMNDLFKAGSEIDKRELINQLIFYIGTNHDRPSHQTMNTVQIFGVAITISFLLLEDLTWEQIVDEYKAKSKENIERQQRNY